MNNQRTRLPVILAAVLLILPVQELQPVYGASSPAQKTGTGAAVETGEFIIPVAEKKRDVPTEVKGTVSVALLSATLPSDVEFTVDPQGMFDPATSPGGQIQSPDNFQVTNNSVIPVRLEISTVKEIRQEDIIFSEKFSSGGDQSFQLVDRVSKAGTQGNAILVLGKAGTVYRSDAEFEQYAIYPGRMGIPVAQMGAGESASLQIYGKVSADMYGSYQFTVKPTLKISAVRGTNPG